MNAGSINPDCNKVTQAAKNILAWEESGKVRILNKKYEPSHIPFIIGQQQNYIVLTMIIPGLEKKLKGFTLDT